MKDMYSKGAAYLQKKKIGAYWKADTSQGDASNEYHILYEPVFPHEILALIIMQRLR